MAPAKDGETVPISLLYRKDTPLDGSSPLLLYGYGAYGITIPAGFSTTALSLVDRGFVYAIAHVRGGKDKGYRWYKDGKREKKVNTFTDFIAAAEFLIGEQLHREGSHRRARRECRRHADGRNCQPGSRAFSRHHCRSAVRRCPDNDARRHVAAHAPGMAGMGQSHHERGRLPHHRGLLALRQCRLPLLSAHPRSRRLDRSPRHLLGAGQVDRKAPRSRGRKRASSVARRTWRPATREPRAGSIG